MKIKIRSLTMKTLQDLPPIGSEIEIMVQETWESVKVLLSMRICTLCSSLVKSSNYTLTLVNRCKKQETKPWMKWYKSMVIKSSIVNSILVLMVLSLVFKMLTKNPYRKSKVKKFYQKNRKKVNKEFPLGKIYSTSKRQRLIKS